MNNTNAAPAAHEEFLFESVHAALSFAYRYSGHQYSPSIMAQMMRGPIKPGKGLSGLDGAGQAGLIRGLVAKLPPNERNMIAARFAAERESLQAKVELIEPAIISMGTGCHSRRLADTLLQRYFGEKVHLADLASHYAMSAPTMTRRWQSVRNAMHSIWERAEEGAYRELRGAGLVG